MKLAEAAGLDLQALGRVVRHTDALTGGPGAIMVRENMKPLEPGHFLYEPFLHTRALGEKDLSLALALGEVLSIELPLAEVALQRLADGLGLPHTARRSDWRRDGRTASQRPREDERGLRLGDAGYAG
ncbi:putative oxidoreductase domain protein [Mycobacterium xenopi 4042]|nr:putative oxidoreductase domain protein [Mycobacterium xenopi 4042]